MFSLLQIKANLVYKDGCFYDYSPRRGCLFITYEVVALDKAVTIDTSAILQEKYKSYIYLRASPAAEKENLTAGNCSFMLFLR